MAFSRSVAKVRAAGRGSRDATAFADGRRPSPSRNGSQAGLKPAGRAPAHARRDPGRACRSFGRAVAALESRSRRVGGVWRRARPAVQMPGWTNVWTMPIQNRVDMLATGVNTPIGIRVLGRNLDDVVRGSEEIARVVKPIAGAVDVVADPIRGKPYIEIRLDRARAARLGVSAGEVNDLIETALGGKVVTSTVEGRERHPVVVRYGRAWREDEESIRNLAGDGPRTAHGGAGVGFAQLEVEAADGSRSPKSPTSRWSRARRRSRARTDSCAIMSGSTCATATRPSSWPRPSWRSPRRPGCPTASTSNGRASSSMRSVRAGRLMLVVPIVVALIFLVLYLTYHDLADALLMMLAVPGAIAGGLFFQWLLGPQALGDGLGRLHRLFRHGDVDRHHHARLPARGGRQGRRPGTDEPDRAAVGRSRRSRAPPAAQAIDGGHGGDRPGADALGQRRRLPRSSGRWPHRCWEAFWSPTR